MTNETTPSQPASPIRAFIAVDLPMGIKAMVGEIQTEMRDYIGPPAQAVKWVRSNGVHLTLQFLGNISPDSVEPVTAAIQAACAGIKPFTLTLGQLGAFPAVKQPRVLWVGLEGEQDEMRQLMSLQSAVSYRMSNLGFKPERGFKPHLTLGRMREDVSRSDLASIATSLADLQSRAVFEASFTVTTVNLMKSALHPGGAVYTTLAEVELGK